MNEENNIYVRWSQVRHAMKWIVIVSAHIVIQCLVIWIYYRIGYAQRRSQEASILSPALGVCIGGDYVPYSSLGRNVDYTLTKANER